MRKILALLSHGENEVTSPHNHIGGSGCSSSGLQLGKQVTINNQRFTLDSVIAEGGFGIVYRVHSSSGRRFALKRTLVNSEAGVSAMKREITIVSSLSHKNIVSYITSQVSEKEPGIYEVLLLTAYYPSSVSRILNERQQKKEAFLESEVLRILADLCEAVSRLHHCQTPIIHRDLKIENVLIDARKNFVLCDFGSATSRVLHPAKHGPLRCQEEIEKYTTLAYRAPEMVDLYTDGGQPLGTPVDIWALGCLTYGVCFFSLPFGSSTLAIQTGQYTTPDSCSYSTKLLKLINYMLTIPISKRPDIHQVAALTFSLLDRPNPVPNVNSSDVPDWLDLPLPRSESDRTAPTARHTAAEGTSVSSAAKSVGLASPPQAAVSEAPQHHTTTTSPCIARQRPRASQTCGRDSTGVVPALAKPPSVQRSSQEPSKSPSHNANHTEETSTPAKLTVPHHSKISASAVVEWKVGHRRGMSEASALLLSAANVRQTHSMGDLIPAVPTPPPPPPRLTPPTSTCSLPPKSATLGPTTSWVAANDIDCDLFGAAFDAIRNQSSRAKR